jgi:hypothetical protein
MNTPAVPPVIGYNIALRHLVQRIADTDPRLKTGEVYAAVEGQLGELERAGRKVWVQDQARGIIRQDIANTVYGILVPASQLAPAPAPAPRRLPASAPAPVPVAVWLCEDCADPIAAGDLASRTDDDPVLCMDCAEARTTAAEDDAGWRAYRR